MNGAIRLGSIAGIPVRIHVTFLLVLPFLAWGFGRIYGEAARAAGVPPDALRGPPFLWGLVVALALFASVLVHELAHSLYARRHGARVRDITLLMIGGVSQISELPGRGREEAIMALVGPVTSLVLGGLFWLAYRAVAAATSLFEVRFVVFDLASLNVALGIFNLLPAFPMDGGRVLRGVLAERLGLLPATRIAAGAGKVFAVLFAIAGFAQGNFLLVIIAFFVYVGAESESRGVLVKAVLGRIRVRDLMRGPLPPVDPATPVLEAGERMLRDRRTALAVGDGARVLGVVTADDVERVPASERSRVRVAEVVRPVPPVDAGDEAGAALRAFEAARATALPVRDGAALVGVLTRADVARGLQLGELEAALHPGDPQEPPRSRWGFRRERHA